MKGNTLMVWYGFNILMYVEGTVRAVLSYCWLCHDFWKRTLLLCCFDFLNSSAADIYLTVRAYGQYQLKLSFFLPLCQDYLACSSDLQEVLQQDPNVQEAERELEEVTLLLRQSLANASPAKPRKTVPITEVDTYGCFSGHHGNTNTNRQKQNKIVVLKT